MLSTSGHFTVFCVVYFTCERVVISFPILFLVFHESAKTAGCRQPSGQRHDIPPWRGVVLYSAMIQLWAVL